MKLTAVLKGSGARARALLPAQAFADPVTPDRLLDDGKVSGLHRAFATPLCGIEPAVCGSASVA